MTAHARTSPAPPDVSRYFTLLAIAICGAFACLRAISYMRAGEIAEWLRTLPFGPGDLAQIEGGAVWTYSLGGEVSDLPSMTVTAWERTWVRTLGIPVEKP